MKLSVLMITYNHEKFIVQALDSVLMQDVHFDYEIVIGEDCSTDGTRNILIEYQKKHPEKIRLLLPKKNLGMHKNFVETYYACQGQYIALLEGDDYWTSPYKLLRQVDFLDSHPECSICFHPVKIISEEDPSLSSVFPNDYKKQISTIEDLVVDNYIPNCSTLFRKGLFEDFPDWFFTLNQADWSLHLLNAQYGDIGYIDEKMAVYRMHSGGVWTGKKLIKRLEAIVTTYNTINIHFDFKYDKLMKPRIAEYYFKMCTFYESSGEFKRAKKCLLKCIYNYFPRIVAQDHAFFVIIIKLYFPFLCKIVASINKKFRNYNQNICC